MGLLSKMNVYEQYMGTETVDMFYVGIDKIVFLKLIFLSSGLGAQTKQTEIVTTLFSWFGGSSSDDMKLRKGCLMKL